MADVDFGDVVDYLASDPNTDAILLYIEAVTHGRKFLRGAQQAGSEDQVRHRGGRREGGCDSYRRARVQRPSV